VDGPTHHLLAVIPEPTLSRKDRPAEAAGTGDGNAGLYSLRARELVFAAGAIPVALKTRADKKFTFFRLSLLVSVSATAFVESCPLVV
jgi:hypothetical protein